MAEPSISVAEQTPAINRSLVIHCPLYQQLSAEDLSARISTFLCEFTVTLLISPNRFVFKLRSKPDNTDLFAGALRCFIGTIFNENPADLGRVKKHL